MQFILSGNCIPSPEAKMSLKFVRTLAFWLAFALTLSVALKGTV
ncbi:hypothetical protein [Paenirhodobacter enshiensis]|nr:hypothetical protein [Paenirhodobacter enshiensis]